MVKEKNKYSKVIFNNLFMIIGNDIMSDELQNAVNKLDKLSKRTQIVRQYVTTGEDIIDKVHGHKICDSVCYKRFVRQHHFQSSQNQVMSLYNYIEN